MHWFQLMISGGVLLLALAAGAPADDREALKPLAEKALKADGGEKLERVRAWTFTEKQTRNGITRTYRRYIQLPDRSRAEFEIERDGKLSKSVIVNNGNKGWSVFDGKLEEMSAEAIAGWREG